MKSNYSGGGDDGLSHHLNTEDERNQSLVATLEHDHEDEGAPRKRVGRDKWLVAKKNMANGQIDSNAIVAVMLVATTYILYGDDIRTLAAFDAGVDLAFLVLSFIVLVLFITEMAILCWCKEKYLRRPNLAIIRNLLTLDSWSDRDSVLSWLAQIGNASHVGSFYFWLDLLSAVSIVVGLPWVNYLGVDNPYDIDSTAADKATIAGENAARVIRMVRLVRLSKFFKYFSTDNNSRASLEGSMAASKASHVGAEMFDRTTKKVVVGILFMLLGIPLLQADKDQYMAKFSMKMAFEHRQWISSNGIDEIEVEQLGFAETMLIGRSHCIDIMYSGFNDTMQLAKFSGRSRRQELREESLDSYTLTDDDYGRSMTAIFDKSGRNREDSFLGILLTSFVLVLLGLAILSFNQDIHLLVILPIEHMMHLVREISENPLGKQLSLMLDDNMHKDDGMETTRLIRTISKIAGLMRVGFGEAGADIIGQNLNFSNGTDRMNLLGNGRKIHSIFGFCDVRLFTDTTECLQEEVMLFVNRIAHILHSIVVQCDGAVNKNIGDAFLLTWKVDNDNITSVSGEDHNYTADKALYSFVKTMIEMCRHEDFLCKFSPRTLSELYERMPGYKCRIGCGLHFGWAIEGAIGSSKKIDASYISPHVYMTESLEGATKEYGTSILMSEPFYNLLSSEAKSGCRKVDVVKKRDSDPVTSLYTYDIDLSVEFSKIKKKTCSKLPQRRKTKFSLIAVQSKSNDTDLLVSGVNNAIDFSMQNHILVINLYHFNSIQGSCLTGENSDAVGDIPVIKVTNKFPNVWRTDEDVVRARSSFCGKQREAWSLGMNAFEAGQWGVAQDHFNCVLDQSGGTDGPSRFLLQRMEEHNFCAPVSWQGFRQT